MANPAFELKRPNDDAISIAEIAEWAGLNIYTARLRAKEGVFGEPYNHKVKGLMHKVRAHWYSRKHVEQVLREYGVLEEAS